jgi:hypothetical protein
MTTEYIIYCDESDDKGRFYSNFYGGALLLANERELIERALTEAKGEHAKYSEFKWTYISEHNEKTTSVSSKPFLKSSQTVS